MSESLVAQFASYQQAEEAANKLLAIRAEQIGIGLAEAPADHVPAPVSFAEYGSDAEMAEELPPYRGSYRLTAYVPPDARELAERIVRSCAGKME